MLLSRSWFDPPTVILRPFNVQRPKRAAELYAAGNLDGAKTAFDEMNHASALVLQGLDRLIADQDRDITY